MPADLKAMKVRAAALCADIETILSCTLTAIEREKWEDAEEALDDIEVPQRELANLLADLVDAQ